MRSQGNEESQAGLGSTHPLRERRGSRGHCAAQAALLAGLAAGVLPPALFPGPFPGLLTGPVRPLRRPSAAQWCSDTSGPCTGQRCTHSPSPECVFPCQRRCTRRPALLSPFTGFSSHRKLPGGKGRVGKPGFWLNLVSHTGSHLLPQAAQFPSDWGL